MRWLLILTVGMCTGLLPITLLGQDTSMPCGAEILKRQLIEDYPELIERSRETEQEYVKAIRANDYTRYGASILTVPVVVHIIHDNGAENISDEQVAQGIEDLNQAFSNQGFYNPNTGVNVRVQFCMAQRTPNGKESDGIVRHVSSKTDMSSHYSHTDITDLATWNTNDYINIRLVRNACLGSNCAGVAGYASPPSAHGLPGDGIVMEARFFGQTKANSTIIVHEMGHYLGLQHTFHGGCKNNDCLKDGDKVCDTPPDKQTGNYPCDIEQNSCTTDPDDPSAKNPFRKPALGGIGDQPDQHQNYLDYSYNECRDRFTQGQKDRMRFFINSERKSLLESKACFPPCDNKTVANFSVSDDTIEVGEIIHLTNHSENATDYSWSIDQTEFSQAKDTSYQFLSEGIYTIGLDARNDDPACSDDFLEQQIVVVCPVQADFSYTLDSNWLYFNDQSVGADQLNWTIRDGSGAELYSSEDPMDSFDVSMQEYIRICLRAEGVYCSDMYCEYIRLSQEGVEICNNSLDDDADGLVDLYDPDCSCSDSAFQAYCPVDCEYIPDTFPGIQLKLKWESDQIGNNNKTWPNIVTGNINNDKEIEVVTKKSIASGSGIDSKYDNKIVILSGNNGSIQNEFKYTQNRSINGSGEVVSIGDLENDGTAELVVERYDSIKFFTNTGDLLTISEPLRGDWTGSNVNIADFNGDGLAEVYKKSTIINPLNGKILAENHTGGKGCNTFVDWMGGGDMFNYFCSYSHTIAADLLPSEGLELAAGNTVYEVSINNLDGTTGNKMEAVYAESPVTDGFTSVGDVDGDGALDVIVVRNSDYEDGGGVWVWNPRTTGIIASAASGIGGGIPFVGDVDGDCLPEIGVTFHNELRMYEYDGTEELKLMYSLPTTDGSGFTGISMFDFNQDGKNELVYRDETQLRIIEGATGKIISATSINSGTGMEAPVVADIDRDGSAEILVSGYRNSETEQRIYCFESAGAPWAPARSVWNQPGYHVTNVNDDLSIPRHPQNQAHPLENWQDCLRDTCPTPYNAFMTQATYRTQAGCVQFPAVDLSIEVLGYECTPDSLFFDLVVHRESETTIPTETIYMACYPARPLNNENLMEVTGLTFERDTMADTVILNDTIRLAAQLPSGVDQMYFVVNDAGTGANADNYPQTGIIECNYQNNVDSIALDIAPKSLNLGPGIEKCKSEVITFNAGAGFDTYLWNDGTTDSIYSSSTAGLHYVETTDQCGRVYRDTVEVSIDPTAEVELGSDRVFCPESQTPGLSIDSTYKDIHWLPGGAVDCDTCPTVEILPDSSFSLMVVAGKDNCLSSDTIDISFRDAVTINESQSVCEGDDLIYRDSTIIGDGATVSDAGIYEIPINNCDSLVLLEVSVDERDSMHLQESICEGDSFLFDGIWRRSAGIYTYTGQNARGCDSIVTLDLEVTDAIHESDTVSICEGDSIELLDRWISETTTIEESFISSAGCDSTQKYIVQIEPLPIGAKTFEICAGDSIHFGETWLSEEGIHEVRIEQQVGCDSIYQVEINTIPPMIEQDTVRICQGDSIEIFNQWISGESTVSKTFTAESGCDSIRQVQILTDPLPSGTKTFEICQGDSVLVGNSWVTGEGTHTVQVNTSADCDSLYEVQINEIPPETVSDTLRLCPGDSVLVFGEWVTSTSTHQKVYTNQRGCDSIQKIIVKPWEVPPGPQASIDCEALEVSVSIDAAAPWSVQWDNGAHGNQTQYTDGDTAKVTLHAHPNCTIDYTLNLPQLPDINSLPEPQDTNIRQDQSISIALDLDTSEWRVLWSPAAIFSCDTCINTTVRPTENTDIELGYIHSSGCVYTTNFRISLSDKSGIYIPNVFSPNGDGINDLWTVYHPDRALRIEEAYIYDRWGNQVAEWNNTSRIEWNGRFNGQQMNPGVFVYYIEFIDENGNEFIRKGDVTLVRAY